MSASPLPQIPDDLLAGGFRYGASVVSWLGGQCLGAVPVENGSVSWDSSQQVQGGLSLTVPRVGAAGEGEDWRDWYPAAPDQPLAPYGQILHVTVTVESVVTGQAWPVPCGRFLITDVDPGPSTVRVTGKSLLQRLEEDRLTSPTAPLWNGTLGSELRRLVDGHMGVIIDDRLVDRWCPSMSWGESRVDAVYEIASAWPASLREGADGILYVGPPTAMPTERPILRLLDGEDGTIVGATTKVTRDKIYNRVVARGQSAHDEGAPSFQAVADQTVGPMRVGGPYGTVTRFFSSPLITSQDAAPKKAESQRASSLRAKRRVPVEHAPNPLIRPGDPVEVTVRGVAAAQPRTTWGIVSAVEIPLTYRGTQKTEVETEVEA